MTNDPQLPCCCTTSDPCPRHLAPQIASMQQARALAADGVDREMLASTLDERGISRRGVGALLGASAFVASPSFAAASPCLP